MGVKAGKYKRENNPPMGSSRLGRQSLTNAPKSDCMLGVRNVWTCRTNFGSIKAVSRRLKALKMELVQKELQAWGEAIVYTAAGQEFELHLGDTNFDFNERVIRLQGPSAKYVIDGDSIESITLHYGHPSSD